MPMSDHDALHRLCIRVQLRARSCFSSQHYDTPMPRPLDAARAPFTVPLDPRFSPPINSSVHRSSTGAKPSSPGLQNNRHDSGLIIWD